MFSGKCCGKLAALSVETGLFQRHRGMVLNLRRVWVILDHGMNVLVMAISLLEERFFFLLI